ncbi:hypothetical protein I553_3031 [Mycobacterium xenopi 4042]|uniref:Uncharacterized protein n=1 Tax=Mycobacterium xenopi 4042 TaxID=1299334 RepID=X7ZPS3_MYCXE|nr:hypothetical protein I553_3031 [Mycobacterium xenopi 4042]
MGNAHVRAEVAPDDHVMASAKVRCDPSYRTVSTGELLDSSHQL